MRWQFYKPHPAFDPWYMITDNVVTTLGDVGVHNGQMVDWEEVEDWETKTPPRPIVNGRRDYTPPPPSNATTQRMLEADEIRERDLISIRSFVKKYCKKEKVYPWELARARFTKGFPHVMGYVASYQAFDDIYYDRVDLLEWTELNRPGWLKGGTTT